MGPAIEHVCKQVNKSRVLEERTKIWFVLAVNVLEHISNNSLFDDSVHVDYDEEELPVNVSLEVPVEKDECVQSVRDCEYFSSSIIATLLCLSITFFFNSALQYLLNKRSVDGSYSFYPRQPGYIW